MLPKGLKAKPSPVATGKVHFRERFNCSYFWVGIKVAQDSFSLFRLTVLEESELHGLTVNDHATLWGRGCFPKAPGYLHSWWRSVSESSQVLPPMGLCVYLVRKAGCSGRKQLGWEGGRMGSAGPEKELHEV